jgi:hypothetical protein
MNWVTNQAHICATLDLDTKDGLTEAIMIAITRIKDKNGKLVQVRLGNTPEDDINFVAQVAETLIRAREIRAGK